MTNKTWDLGTLQSFIKESNNTSKCNKTLKENKAQMCLNRKIQAILHYKLSETVQDLKTFLAIINFYHRY